MASLTLRVDTGVTDTYVQTNNANITAMNLSQMFKGFASGGIIAPATLRTDVATVAASGTVTLSSASGSCAIVINGVSTAITASGTDVQDAASFVTAINASADPLISGLVTASSGGTAVVTLTAAVKGKMGNAITTTASGTGMTADQARLTAGSDGTTTSFTY